MEVTSDLIGNKIAYTLTAANAVAVSDWNNKQVIL